jgi:hypothetical protein
MSRSGTNAAPALRGDGDDDRLARGWAEIVKRPGGRAETKARLVAAQLRHRAAARFVMRRRSHRRRP